MGCFASSENRGDGKKGRPTTYESLNVEVVKYVQSPKVRDTLKAREIVDVMQGVLLFRKLKEDRLLAVAKRMRMRTHLSSL